MGEGVDMDEFYQEINAIFYLKWIIIQGEKYKIGRASGRERV